jgi:hypothetical protein
MRKSVPCSFCGKPCLARAVVVLGSGGIEPCHDSCGKRHITRKATAAERAAILAPVPAEEYWTTKDGHRIAVGEMNESHVRNALRMVLRKVRRARQRQRLQEEMIAWLRNAPDESNFWDNDESGIALGDELAFNKFDREH